METRNSLSAEPDARNWQRTGMSKKEARPEQADSSRAFVLTKSVGRSVLRKLSADGGATPKKIR